MTILKSLNKNEGWYFINDTLGQHFGQIYLGLEIESNDINYKNNLRDTLVPAFESSVSDDFLYNRHKNNLSELDNITLKMRN